MNTYWNDSVCVLTNVAKLIVVPKIIFLVQVAILHDWAGRLCRLTLSATLQYWQLDNNSSRLHQL